DGIRDLYVTGVQTCALPIYDGSDEAIRRGMATSQDVWAFEGPVKPVAFSDFALGKPGCDNRIAYELGQAGYEVLNPCLSIKTYRSEERRVGKEWKPRRVSER